ncbi:MAG: hypothetical protein GC157_07800 [Frankiales bacterium]|nr:hypothetical protein [Frankiales bacterium]
MTRSRPLLRTALVAACALLVAVPASGPALAGGTGPTGSAAGSTWSRAGAVVADAARAVAPDPRPTRGPAAPARPAATRPAASATPAATARATKAPPAPRATTTPAPKAPSSPPAPSARVISRYVDAPGSQAAIDRCNLVLWTHQPLWLAGHNYCGYQWLAFVPTGTTVRVTSGVAAGTYVVTGHQRLDRQSGALPHVSADLVLQTCVGSATGLTLLRRA